MPAAQRTSEADDADGAPSLRADDDDDDEKEPRLAVSPQMQYTSRRWYVFKRRTSRRWYVFKRRVVPAPWERFIVGLGIPSYLVRFIVG